MKSSRRKASVSSANVNFLMLIWLYLIKYYHGFLFGLSELGKKFLSIQYKFTAIRRLKIIKRLKVFQIITLNNGFGHLRVVKLQPEKDKSSYILESKELSLINCFCSKTEWSSNKQRSWFFARSNVSTNSRRNPVFRSSRIRWYSNSNKIVERIQNSQRQLRWLHGAKRIAVGMRQWTFGGNSIF